MFLLLLAGFASCREHLSFNVAPSERAAHGCGLKQHNGKPSPSKQPDDFRLLPSQAPAIVMLENGYLLSLHRRIVEVMRYGRGSISGQTCRRSPATCRGTKHCSLSKASIHSTPSRRQ